VRSTLRAVPAKGSCPNSVRPGSCCQHNASAGEGKEGWQDGTEDCRIGRRGRSNGATTAIRLGRELVEREPDEVREVRSHGGRDRRSVERHAVTARG